MTGANGHLGRRLLRHLAAAHGAVPRALVRSRFAADSLASLAGAPQVEVWTADYGDEPALEQALEGCTRVAHLAGILKETRTSRYVDAHERATRGARARRRARGRAPDRLPQHPRRGARLPERLPRLEGPRRAHPPRGKGAEHGAAGADGARPGRDRAPSRCAPARARASPGWCAAARASSSPSTPRIWCAASRAPSSDPSDAHRALDLVGPESLPRRELLARAAALLGTRPRVVPIPYAVARLAARVFEALSASPPLTRAMLGRAGARRPQSTRRPPAARSASSSRPSPRPCGAAWSRPVAPAEPAAQALGPRAARAPPRAVADQRGLLRAGCTRASHGRRARRASSATCSRCSPRSPGAAGWR